MAFTFGHGEDRYLKARIRIAFYIAVAFFSLMLARLWYLQIFQGAHFRQESEENSIRMKEILASRGMIRDRFGKLIIDNKPNYVAGIVPEDVRDKNRLIGFMSDAVSMPVTAIAKKLQDYRGPRYLPVPIKRGLSWSELARLEAHRFEFPGLDIAVESRRSYIYGDIAPHLLGYLSEISPDELNAWNAEREDDRYQQGDQIGKGGIERRYESILKGRDGYKTVRVDSLGREIAELGRHDPKPGTNLHLTLDLDLQLYAREVFKDKVGVLLALDPRTGEILSVVNSPRYDPELFSGGISSTNWIRLRDDPDHPLENRAIRGLYPPGSTYKIIPAVAALETKTVTPWSKVYCSGYYRFGNRTFRCWKPSGHGWVDVKDAIKHSCDVFFYTMGEKLGVDKLAEYASHLGLGRPTGIDVDGEKGGIVPSSGWKLNRFKEPWYPGETISVAIGQGYNLATPLQVATVYGALGIGGKVYRPHLFRSAVDENGETVKRYEPVLHDEIRMSPSTLNVVRAGLSSVVNEPGGTAYWSRLPFKNIRMAGKTGTAQVVGYKGDARSAGSAELEDHAWFVGFAPVDNPTIVAVALVENGGHGSSTAAPLVKQLLTRYFELTAERQGVSIEDFDRHGGATVHTADGGDSGLR